MAGFLEKLRKGLGRTVDQVNPFDGGKTWQNQTPSPRPVQQAPAPRRNEFIQPQNNTFQGQPRSNPYTRDAFDPAARSFMSKLYDQANVFDNNRTWKQATPTANRNVLQQAGVVGKNVVVNPILVPAKNMVTNTLVKQPYGYVKAFGEAYGTGTQGSFADKLARVDDLAKRNIRSYGASGDILKDVVAPGIDTGTNILSLGIGGFTANQFKNQLGKEGFKQAVKGQLPNVTKNAYLNAAQGANQELYSDNPTIKGAAQKAALNVAIGTPADIALGAGLYGLSKNLPNTDIKVKPVSADFDPNINKGMGGKIFTPLKEDSKFPGSFIPAKLPEVVNDAKLFEKYPTLKDVTVKYHRPGEKAPGLTGLYDAKTKTISLPSDMAQPSSLVHEIQHAIQDTEGRLTQTRATGYHEYAAHPLETEARAKADVLGNQYKSAQPKDLPIVEKPKKQLPSATAPPKVPKATDSGLKVRGFRKNIEKTLPDNVNAQTVAESIPGYKPITNKKTLTKAANAIAENPLAEFARVVTKKQLDSAEDIATGNLLLREAIERGDTEAAVQLGTKLGIDGTKLGQAVQAYATFKKTTPEGIVTYASKKAMKSGKELDSNIANDLITKAKQLADMPEGVDKARATRELLGQADKVGSTWKDKVVEILAVPRSAMATLDFSAPLRQGAVLGTRYPVKFAKAFGESVKYFASPKYYEKSMYELTQRPSYGLMKKSKLAVNAAEDMTGTEEQFMSSILEGKIAKKLVVGHAVAASSRAYSGFLAKLRADVFDGIVKDFGKSGVKLDDKATTALAKFINSASGRGSGATLDRHGGLLSQVLFSPRLWKSRIDTLNPVYYARLDPVARKLALQSAATFTATTATILSLAKLNGAEVEDDPRSADFGKIKVGNTRYDILGGHQQNIRLASQLISGQKINSTTGEVQTLGPDRGFGKPSRLDLAYQFLENKENPVLSFASKALRGTNQVGEPINLASEAAKLVVPLGIQNTAETTKSTGNIGKSVAMNVPGVFGVGVQTYGKPGAPKPGESKEGVYTLNQNDDGKYEYTIDGKTFKSDKLTNARIAIVKDSFKKSKDTEKLVNGIYYYKDAAGDIHTTSEENYRKRLASSPKGRFSGAGTGRGARRSGSRASGAKKKFTPPKSSYSSVLANLSSLNKKVASSKIKGYTLHSKVRKPGSK